MKKIIKRIFSPAINFITDIAMVFFHFSFPEYYNWRWKWQMAFWDYEPETVALFKEHVKRGMTVVDIGAHIGYFTRILSKLVGNDGVVYAFEPAAENFKMLQNNTVHLKNVKIYQLALSDKQGPIDFYLSGGRSGTHSTVIGVTSDQKKITVPAVDLDSFLAGEKIARADFIKMDIEGGEPLAFSGMKNILSGNKNIILISEFAPYLLKAAGLEPLEYLRRIRSLGFEVFAILEGELMLFNPLDDEDIKRTTPSHFINIYCVRG